VLPRLNESDASQGTLIMEALFLPQQDSDQTCVTDWLAQKDELYRTLGVIIKHDDGMENQESPWTQWLNCNQLPLTFWELEEFGMCIALWTPLSLLLPVSLHFD